MSAESVRAESTTTGTVVHPRSPASTSSPSRSGSPRSSTTTSGLVSAAARNAPAPVVAVVTSYPRTPRLMRSARTSPGSSSTTSTRVRGGASLAAEGCPEVTGPSWPNRRREPGSFARSLRAPHPRARLTPGAAERKAPALSRRGADCSSGPRRATDCNHCSGTSRAYPKSARRRRGTRRGAAPVQDELCAFRRRKYPRS